VVSFTPPTPFKYLTRNPLSNAYEVNLVPQPFQIPLSGTHPRQGHSSLLKQNNQRVNVLLRCTISVSVICLVNLYELRRVTRRRLQYLGHVVRKEDTVPKKILDQHPGGRRKHGRPRKRWLDDVTKDLELLQIRG
jgi:hypothetical protein